VPSFVGAGLTRPSCPARLRRSPDRPSSCRGGFMPPLLLAPWARRTPSPARERCGRNPPHFQPRRGGTTLSFPKNKKSPRQPGGSLLQPLSEPGKSPARLRRRNLFHALYVPCFRRIHANPVALVHKRRHVHHQPRLQRRRLHHRARRRLLQCRLRLHHLQIHRVR